MSAWARVSRAIADAEDQDADRVLRWAHEIILGLNATSSDPDDEEQYVDPSLVNAAAVNLNLRSRMAIVLAEVGLVDADEIAALVPIGTALHPFRHDGTDRGFLPHRTPLRVRALRYLRNEGTPPAEAEATSASGGNQSRDVATERFRVARDRLGDLEGQLLAARAGRGAAPHVAGMSDPIVRLLEVPTNRTDDRLGWHAVRGAVEELFQRLIDLAHRCGSSELLRLLDRFGAAWADPVRSHHWNISTQHQVLRAAVRHPEARQWVQQQLQIMNGQMHTGAVSLHDRGELWLDQATLLALAGDNDGARSAARAAVRTSVGLGFHDEDRHLTDCIDWLEAAAADATLDLAQAIDRYAARISGAPADAERDSEKAAQRLVQLAFRTNPALACAMAESFCEAGVMSSENSISALVTAASIDPAVPAMLTAAIACYLLLPSSKTVPRTLLRTVRAAGGDVAFLIDHAVNVWAQGGEEHQDVQLQDRHATSTPAEVSPAFLAATTAGGLLREMRALPAPAGTAEQWHHTIARIGVDTVSVPIIRALLSEATRLRVVGAGVGLLISRAMELGLRHDAESALRTALTQSPAYGWLSHTDGGTRFKLLKAALATRSSELVQVAAQDLAMALSSGGLHDWLRPDDLRRIVSLIGGDDAVPATWDAVSDYLDVLAPPAADFRLPEHLPATSPAEALIRWVTSYLGHPVRPIDFGARKVLQCALHVAPDASESPIAEAIDRTGWTAEAALLAIATIRPPLQRLAEVSSIAAAITRATATPDMICRTAARRAARQMQLPVLTPPPAHDLPAFYSLELPTLPGRRAPELNFEGVPHVDVTDPRQVIAPFDHPVDWMADEVDIDRPTAMYRAAALGTSATAADPWLRAGHYPHADRLSRRGERQGYRPWAYMVGRRAVGLLLGELVDAGHIGELRYVSEFVNEKLMHVEPQPRDASMPAPWRPDDADDYQTSGWVEGVDEAARIYAGVIGSYRSHYVLAERTEWRAGSWGKPTELRVVSTSTPAADDHVRSEPFDEFMAPGDWYPSGVPEAWTSGATAVRAILINFSDPRWEQWLALHPAIAQRLGWVPDLTEPFAWRGHDGLIRARTVLRQIGHTERRSPGWSYAAFGWQVLVSPTGHAEMVADLGELRRIVQVQRAVEKDHDHREARTARAQAIVRGA